MDFSSSPAYDDGTPAPLGWKRQLVPRVGKGLTPTKTDVIYIAPNGEEIKSKTQLQRYLKAHKDGPAVSEFNWSSGETPRRSGRLTSKTPTNAMEVDVTPNNSKRKAVDEESNEEKPVISHLPKRTKKSSKTVPVEKNDTGAPSAEDKETIEDIGEKGGSPEAAIKPLAANGHLHGSEEEEIIAEKEVGEEGGSLLSAEVVAKTVAANGNMQLGKMGEKAEVGTEKIVEEGAFGRTSEIEVTAKHPELFEGSSANSEKLQNVSEPMHGKISIEKEETIASTAKSEESLEILKVKYVAEEKDFQSQEKNVECPLAEEELSEANHHAEKVTASALEQECENSLMQEANHSAEPTGAN